MTTEESKRARRHPWLAAVLTLLLPGLGQTYAGRLRRGIAVFAILSLARLVTTWALLAVPPSPWLLAVVMATSLGLLVGAAADAVRVARAAERPYQLKSANRWYAYVAVVAIAVAIQATSENLWDRFLEAVRNPSAAMSETLLVDDWIFVDRRASTRAALARGAIVVYESTDGSGEKIVKRVAGLPGDTLAARNDTLIRNGRVIAEPYVRLAARRPDDGAAPSAELRSWGPLRVPADSIFVLGDNRNASYDSRHVGFIPIRNVLGTPRLIYYSFDHEGDWALPFLTAIRWRRLGTMPQ